MSIRSLIIPSKEACFGRAPKGSLRPLARCSLGLLVAQAVCCCAALATITHAAIRLAKVPLLLLIILGSFAGIAYAQEEDISQVLDHFQPPDYEEKCFQHFDDTASGVNLVNAFFLAKMSELMYLERLDYQLRYFENDACPLDTVESSEWLFENCRLSDHNFEKAYQKRFQHYFDGQLESAPYAAGEQEVRADNHLRFKFIHKSYLAQYHFMGIPYVSGVDPELMIISTPKTILIVFRGTDYVGGNAWAEWIGTDFRIFKSNAGGALHGTRLHTGFWLSFDFIRDDLIATLTEFGGNEKNIWVTGHSLGAALAIITGVYLKASDFNVQNIYTFAAPRSIGNKAFAQKADTLLPNRIHRFEYAQDPVTMVWPPVLGYKNVGKRHWFDTKKEGDFKFYTYTQERRFFGRPLKKYPQIDKSDKKEARRIKRHQFSGSTFIRKPMLNHHNPQWYTRATYNQLEEDVQVKVPSVDDPYPFFYYYQKNAK